MSYDIRKENAVMTLKLIKTTLAVISGLGIALFAAAASADVDYSNADTGTQIASGSFTGKTAIYAWNDAFGDPE